MFSFKRIITNLRIVSNKNNISAIYNLQHKNGKCLNNRKLGNVNYLHTSIYYNAKINFNLSDIGEGIREVIVKEWFVKVGDKVSQFDNICEVQSDKASVTITSRYDGIITKLYHDIENTALVGKPLVEIETEDVDEVSSSSSSESESEDQVKTPEKINAPEEFLNEMLCIPSVRRLAKEHNLNLSKITGTGKRGRILKEDVLKYLELTNTHTPIIPDVSLNVADVDKIEPFKGFQRAMFRTMTDSLKIPHFLYCDEISMNKISDLRELINKELDERGRKLSFMPFFVKAASNALLKYPILNSTILEDEGKVCYKGLHNIGVAMDTKNGLAVPVIKNVNKLSIVEIAHELNRLLKTGKDGNFATSDLSGATFTISNIGNIGGTYTKPVISPPQVAIIAIGAVKVLPRFDDNLNVRAEKIVAISSAGDHRIIDGATMAHFINLFKKQMENPLLLLLNL